MGAAVPVGARLCLALTLCLAAGAAEPDGRPAGRKDLPPPSNLHYSFGQLCKLKWTWNPAEGISSGCDLKYCSEIFINGIPQDNREWTKNLFREEDVSLNEEVYFRVRSECKFDNTSELSNWVEIFTTPKGAAGTAAVGINCTWYDLEYMICTWLPGRNASASTNYTLYYWYEGLGRRQQCQNYIYGDNFGCNFSLSIPNCTNVYPTISILIRGNSEEIRPVCANKNPTTIVKPGPPRIVTVSMIKDEIHLEWQKPGTFPAHCLVYQVELKDSKSDSGQPYNFKALTKARFPSVHPNTVYIVKVRAGFEGTCYSSSQWSDWSEEKSIGENTDFTFYIVLILTIPLTVAVATIILLVYLKRLKILIYPQIPDPRKIIKRMFGEQIEDFQGGLGDDFLNVNKPAVEEEISSLVWLENPESSTSENEDRERPALQVKAL
ncbi:interleukin-13 receptor subunit alpha-1 isoform X1 [Mauremys reevesii]|uniref:interleukin-13 receptor subunit alpha-1 isoform X1 n=1 Tax=Mauremys reevesii TaxID=260615 RepID=UPI00193FAA16|nr:interleukin-13 receptor subunit alpha-1 isoform X1 [Mauremys reevesii]